MKYIKPTEKMVFEMLEALKSLGFVGNGNDNMVFAHTKLNRNFDFSAYSIEGALLSVVDKVFHERVNLGGECARQEIREGLGL